jgi:hypothetical protein
MAIQYHINKGTGKMVEFIGLKGQYFTAFFAGTIIVVLLMFIMRAVLPSSIVYSLVVVAEATVVWYCITYNKKYGAYGLQKRQARTNSPKFVSNRKSFFTMLPIVKKKK